MSEYLYILDDTIILVTFHISLFHKVCYFCILAYFVKKQRQPTKSINNKVIIGLTVRYGESGYPLNHGRNK